MSDEAKRTAFANALVHDFDRVMHDFFEDVDRKRTTAGLTDDEVEAALNTGYGDVVADAWHEWVVAGA